MSKLEILIVTMPSRYKFLSQLLSLLEPQVAGNKFSTVDIRISADDCDLPVGDRREKLRQRATGDYISFVDDDDLLSPDYISSIVPLLNGVDQVGFRVQLYAQQRKLRPTYHSLKYGNWFEEPDAQGEEGAYFRDISHICPMRRELALKVPMSGGVGEDRRWSDGMRGLVLTENYVPRVLYHYIYRGCKDDAKDPHDPWRLALIEQLRAAQ